MPTGSNGDCDDGSIPLGCEGHADPLAHPAAADGEDGFFIALTCLLVSATLPPPPIVHMCRLLDGGQFFRVLFPIFSSLTVYNFFKLKQQAKPRFDTASA